MRRQQQNKPFLPTGAQERIRVSDSEELGAEFLYQLGYPFVRQHTIELDFLNDDHFVFQRARGGGIDNLYIKPKPAKIACILRSATLRSATLRSATLRSATL